MSGEIRTLQLSEGVEVTADESFVASGAYVLYASDAAYVSAKGTLAENGDTYYNTSTHVVRLYRNGVWTDDDSATVATNLATHTTLMIAHGANGNIVGENSLTAAVSAHADLLSTHGVTGNIVGETSLTTAINTHATLVTGAHSATAIMIDASTFSTNLDASITNVQLLADAVDVLVTGGSGGGLDVLTTLSSDEDDGTWITGNATTLIGGSILGTFTKQNATNPLRGTYSYTLANFSVNDFVLSPEITLPREFRARTLAVDLMGIFASATNALALAIYDETNNVELNSSEVCYITSDATSAVRAIKTAYVPESCTSMRVGAKALASSTGTFQFDSIEVTRNPYVIASFTTTEYLITPAKQGMENWLIVQAQNAMTDISGEAKFNLSTATITKDGAASTEAQLKTTSNICYATDGTNETRFYASVKSYFNVDFSALGAAQGTDVKIYKNGGPYFHSLYTPEATYRTNSSCVVPMNAGDYICIYTGNWSNEAASCYLNIHAIAANATFLAALPIEPVVAIYESNAGQSIGNNSTTIIDYEDKIIDTHNAVTKGASWKFTAPQAGSYHVDAVNQFNNTVFNTLYYIYKNNSAENFLDKQGDSTTDNVYTCKGSATIYLNKGDYIDIRILQTNTGGTAKAFSTTANRNRVSITLQGIKTV